MTVKQSSSRPDCLQLYQMLIVTDRVCWKSDAIGRVRPSARLCSIFWTNWLYNLIFACVRVTTIAYWDVTVKVISHVRRSMQIVRATRVSTAASYEYWLVATVVGFHCDVAISCKLARRRVRHGAAVWALWRGRSDLSHQPRKVFFFLIKIIELHTRQLI